MKFLNTLLKLLAVILSLFSVIVFLYSLYQFRELIYVVDIGAVYSFLSTYSGLYNFTFIVLALLLTLHQIQLAQETNKETLNQIKFTQDDILLKRNKEINDETLVHCKYYFTDIQACFKELTELGAFDRMPIKWDFLKSVDSESLKEHGSYYKIALTNIDEHRKEILLCLYKLEAFSAMFVRGNLDLNLGKEIIGYTYYAQTELCLGLIALFRTGDQSPFCKDVLELRTKWKSQIIY